MARAPTPEPEDWENRQLDRDEIKRVRALLISLSSSRIESVVLIVEGYDRRRWLRAVAKSGITWGMMALALFAALRDEILHMLGRGGP